MASVVRQTSDQLTACCHETSAVISYVIAESMEPFYLYDIIYTKSTERVVSPMVADLYHLIITTECGEVNYEALPGLEKAAEELVSATGQLASTARRLAEESDDEVIKQEMLPASENLLVSGKNILLAAQKLLIHPDDRSCIKELVASAKRILVEIIKVLQTEDDATVRRIIHVAHWLLDCLLMLESAQDVSALLAAFHSFSEALLLLTNLTERFLWDLKESSHQKGLAQTLQILKKCIPMLYTAKLSNLKHPRDQQVKLSKSYIFELAESTIKELISLLKNAGTKKLHERNGLFPQHLHKLLSLLSDLQPIDLYEGKLNFHVEALVFYCVLLADSSRTDIKQRLIKLCQHLLTLRKLIAVDVSTMEGAHMENQLGESLKEKCCIMRTELGNLDAAVRTAILFQILDNFTDAKGPLKRLVEAAVERCGLARKEGSLRELQPLISQFFSHSSQMIKATSFVLVTCTVTETVQEIEECIDHLTGLLATVPALLCEITGSSADNSESEKLHLLCQTWSSTTESLLKCLDTVINPHEFLDLSVQEMVRHKEGSEKALDNQHSGEFSWHASNLSSQAVQMVEFISRHVDRTRDPIFRNGLLVLIKQLENAIQPVKISTDQCVATIANQQARNAFSKRAQVLIESACNVRMGLDECNQPDILSPLRDGVRNHKISERPPSCFAPQDPLELSAKSTLEQNTADSAELLEGISRSLPVSLSSPQIPKRSISFSECGSERVDLHPLISELIIATKTHNITKLNGACSDLLELLSCFVDAAKEGLQVAKSPVLEKLLRYKEMVELTPCLISLAKEVATNSTSNVEGLLQKANSLSQWICEASQCLAIVAGPWYSLAMQLFCKISPSGFLDYTQTLDEIIKTLETVVQLVGKTTLMDHNKNLPEFPSVYETYLRIQAKFTCILARNKELLEKALSAHNSHSDKAKQGSFNRTCTLWSVTIKAFLNLVDKFIGRDILSLRELKTKMKHQLCLQSMLAAVLESSLRIQEATRLSLQLCAEQSAKEDILALRKQMKVLTEVVLQVAGALSASPLPAPKLSVRFELLQTELALTAKILLLQLGVINKDYLSSIQNVIRVTQPMAQDQESDSSINKETFKKKAGQLLANVKNIKKMIGDAFGNASSLKPRGNLLSAADHLLFLTEEVMGRAEMLQSQLDKECLLEDCILHQWSAEAGYLVTQLQSTKGINERDLEHIVRRLQNDEGHSCSSQTFCIMQPDQHKEEDNMEHQTSPRHRVTETGPDVLPAMKMKEMHDGSLQSSYLTGRSNCNSRGSPTESLGDSEKWWSSGCPVSQATKEMTTHMSHMALFLKRKGPITTKEQLIACATKIIAGGQALVKFAGIIAKNCLDEKCASELLNAMEQTKTISYQLSILSRVNASTGRSRSSAEHLVSNAQNLTQAALQMLKAAEVASVKGLQQPPSSSEEADVTAFCSLWRKSLWWHRAKEVLHSDRDELGLRKTGMWIEPTFMSMIQEEAAQWSDTLPNTLENK